MAKIYQFPNMRDRHQIETQMEGLQDTMRELYDSLRKIELGHKMIQGQVYDIEDTYQELIQAYATIVGNRNVADKWLEYCTYVGMDRDPDSGKITITFTPPSEEEFTDDEE